MHHRSVTLTVHQRPAYEPLQKLVSIRGFQDAAEGIPNLALSNALRDREQMKIMVSEDDRDTPIMRPRPSKDAERVRTSIDEVSDEPDSIGSRIEINLFEKAVERGKTSLYVPDDVGRHGSIIRHDRKPD